MSKCNPVVLCKCIILHSMGILHSMASADYIYSARVEAFECYQRHRRNWSGQVLSNKIIRLAEYGAIR